MRPLLTKETDPAAFREYYWLKNELAGFCRQAGLPAGGGKQELADRIFRYLSTGRTDHEPPKNKPGAITGESPLTLESPIPPGYRNDERHRAFFRSVMGPRFKFNVPFMDRMKGHAGSTYREAVSEWHRIDAAKKGGALREIAPQFEYNRYTRDFFADNPGLTRSDAITCWNHKKSLPGHNRYERPDLEALDQFC
jgi:hypothetical protein